MNAPICWFRSFIAGNRRWKCRSRSCSTEPGDSLSPRVQMRAQLLKVMKTAMAIRRQARSEAERRLGRLFVEQLLEIMPELKEVSGWPAVGHRRRADEMGRIGENPISDDWLHEAS